MDNRVIMFCDSRLKMTAVLAWHTVLDAGVVPESPYACTDRLRLCLFSTAQQAEEDPTTSIGGLGISTVSPFSTNCLAGVGTVLIRNARDNRHGLARTNKRYTVVKIAVP